MVIFSGNGVNSRGEEKRYNVAYEPPLPVKSPMYRCENCFRLEMLEEMLEDKRTYGFIIIDRSSCLLGVVSGNLKRKLDYYETDVPQKHKKGGQSQARIQRIRCEKIHAHMVKAGEKAKRHFMEGAEVLVDGVVVGGTGDLKEEIQRGDFLHKYLREKIIKIVDLEYNGMSGFSSAVSKAGETMNTMRYIEEKNAIRRMFEKINRESDTVTYGYSAVETCLENGMVETLILWEDLKAYRYQTEEGVKYGTTPPDCKVTGQTPYIEWIFNRARELGGVQVVLVSDTTEEGAQFCRGFGGVGATLYYPLSQEEMCHIEEEDSNSDDFI